MQSPIQDMTEEQIIEGLLARDERITYDFFFTFKEKSCKKLLISIINYVFSYPVEYDEVVSEFYSYIMEKDAYRLRQIQERNTLFGWMKVSAIRFFIKKRDNLIENRSNEALIEKQSRNLYEEESTKTSARTDMMRILFRMDNKRYAYVLQQLILNDMEPEKLAESMRITSANLYNIKKRAIAEFTKVARRDVIFYGGR